MDTAGLIARVVLLPLAVAFTTAWGCRLAFRGRMAAVGPLCGFLLGYLVAFAFVERHAWNPDRHWHWLPYATVAAVVLGGVAIRLKARSTAVVTIALCGLAGWLLAPKWMKPPALHIPLLAIYLWSLMTLLGVVLRRPRISAAPGFLVATSLAVAAMTAGFVSLGYGELAAIPAAVLAGVALANVGRMRDSIAGLIPAWVMSTAGVAYIGCVEPEEPLWGLLLAPAAPLWTAACLGGPLSRLGGIRQTLAQWGCLIAGLAAAALVTLVT